MLVANPAQADSHLVEAARAGSREAFGALVERYQSLICAIAYSFTGNVAESEELAQEAFLVAWNRLAQLRQPERFRGWLVGITRNLGQHRVRDHRNKRSLRKLLIQVNVVNDES